MKNIEKIDDYIALFPSEVQERLQNVRQIAHQVAPEATEAIAYQMPTFKINGKNLFHFAAFEHHIGLYPLPSAVKKFEEELSSYKQGKGSVQFPLDEPMPYDLIRKIFKFRKSELG